MNCFFLGCESKDCKLLILSFQDPASWRHHHYHNGCSNIMQKCNNQLNVIAVKLITVHAVLQLQLKETKALTDNASTQMRKSGRTFRKYKEAIAGWSVEA